EPVLCLDGDAAGRRAAFRAIERALPLLQPGRSLRFALLPEGEDPDSLLRLRGAAALRQAIDGAQPLAAMLWGWQLQEQGQGSGRFDTPERRTALWKAVTGALARIPDGELREAFRMDLAERFAAAFGYRPGGSWTGPRPPKKAGRGRGREAVGTVTTRTSRPVAIGLSDRYEQRLLRMLIAYPALVVERAEDCASLELESPELRRLLRAVLDLMAKAPDLDTAELKCHLSELGFSGLVDHLFRRGVHDLRGCERSDTPLAKVRSEWIEYLTEIQRRRAELEAEEMGRRFAADMSEENLVRLQAKQRLSGGDGGRKVDADGYRGAGSFESD
ncbi:MAG: hypothetical protein ACFCUQ_00480, partial [Kiloniellales bacterium]